MQEQTQIKRIYLHTDEEGKSFVAFNYLPEISEGERVDVFLPKTDFDEAMKIAEESSDLCSKFLNQRNDARAQVAWWKRISAIYFMVGIAFGFLSGACSGLFV